MMEKLNYIMYSWSEYIRSNNIIGVYLIALAVSLIILISVTQNNTPHTDTFKRLIINKMYTKNLVPFLFMCTAVTLLLILPLSAFVLMQFQTVFYSYNVLWCMALIVPVTSITLTLVFTIMADNLKKRLLIPSVALMLLLLFLCGNMTKSNVNYEFFEAIHHQVTLQQSQPLFDKLEEYSNSAEYNGEITILAPLNITAYAHTMPGSTRTLYGKDMWDKSMAPYTYNEYPEEYYKLYTWANCIEAYGTFYALDDQTPLLSNDLGPNEYLKLSSYEDAENAVKNDLALGGITYIDLAKKCGIDILVIYTNGNNIDEVCFDFIIELTDLTNEYVPINESEGYILLFLK